MGPWIPLQQERVVHERFCLTTASGVAPARRGKEGETMATFDTVVTFNGKHYRGYKTGVDDVLVHIEDPTGHPQIDSVMAQSTPAGWLVWRESERAIYPCTVDLTAATWIEGPRTITA